MGCTISVAQPVNNGPVPERVFVNNREPTEYVNHPEGVILCCYFNPKKSQYRLKAFNQFYNSIKHLNHRIIELAIGEDPFELNHLLQSNSYSHVRTDSLLWHKESLLNILLKNLPTHFKYVFWLDTDVTFTNLYWMTQSVEVSLVYMLDLPLYLTNSHIHPHTYLYARILLLI